MSIVNVASTAAGSRARTPGAYSAAKFARPGGPIRCTPRSAGTGSTSGWCCPGSRKTEGFPATELLAKPVTRWLVTSPEVVADAIIEAGPGGKPERYVPRYYWMPAALRIVAPRVLRRAIAGARSRPRRTP